MILDETIAHFVLTFDFLFQGIALVFVGVVVKRTLLDSSLNKFADQLLKLASE